MKTKALAAAAALTATAGYMIGVLTAPKSGKATRRDIAKGANKAKIQSERQLKKLHSEMQDTIKDAEALRKKAGVKARKEIDQAITEAKAAKDKAREVLSAVRQGEADDPNLLKAVKDLQDAKKNLMAYIKKKK